MASECHDKIKGLCLGKAGGLGKEGATPWDDWRFVYKALTMAEGPKSPAVKKHVLTLFNHTFSICLDFETLFYFILLYG